jgi:hypothetical protein
MNKKDQYFDTSSVFATAEEFMKFVVECSKNGHVDLEAVTSFTNSSLEAYKEIMNSDFEQSGVHRSNLHHLISLANVAAFVMFDSAIESFDSAPVDEAKEMAHCLCHELPLEISFLMFIAMLQMSENYFSERAKVKRSSPKTHSEKLH